jgi:hypothetical protein
MENKGISQFIKTKLEAISADKALAMKGLVEDVMTAYPHIKDTTNASIRINSVLNQAKVKDKYTRIKSGDGRVYIILKEAIVPVTSTTGLAIPQEEANDSVQGNIAADAGDQTNAE